jgi:DNA-3-methyladenine glycosylase
MKLNKSFDGEDITKSKKIWLESNGKRLKKSCIVAGPRIGIDYAKEWAKKPWRFYVKDNSFVSRK